MGDPCEQIAGKAFADMTAPEKRVAIALDVIAQLKAQAYTAQTGVYVFVRKPRNVRPQDAVLAAKSCTVCAIGSAFVSALRLGGVADGESEDCFSDGSVHADGYGANMALSMREYFPPDMLAGMELAFETRVCGVGFSADIGDDDRFRYVTWARSLEPGERDPTHRLVAIMQNVIRNGGDFNVDDPPRIERCGDAGP